MTMDVIALDTSGNATELESLMCVFLHSSSQVKTLTVKGIFEKKTLPMYTSIIYSLIKLNVFFLFDQSLFYHCKLINDKTVIVKLIINVMLFLVSYKISIN